MIQSLDPRQVDAAELSARVRTFLSATRFCTIATIDPDGGPRQAVVWYRLDGDQIVLNSKVGRRWPANLGRDERISVAVYDVDQGEHWVGLTGRVAVVDDQATAQADIAEMARRYNAHDPAVAERKIAEFEGQTRISFRVRIDGVHDHLG